MKVSIGSSKESLLWAEQIVV